MNPMARDLDYITEQTRPLWEEAHGKSFFITGGTGFFGCWLLESFCWVNRVLGLNASAVALTRNPEAFTHRNPHLASDPSLKLLAGDVRGFKFPEGSFDYVIHAATDGGGTGATELEVLDTIVDGTRHTLDFACASGAKKFLLTSSGAVYGPQPATIDLVEESFGGSPSLIGRGANYSEGKRLAELLCNAYTRRGGIECKVVRCFAFVGAHLPLDSHFAIGNFIGNALRGEPLRIRGDGTPLRSYLYMADTMIWLWTILFRAPSLRPYNLGSERAICIRDLAHQVADTLSPGAEIIVEQTPVPGAPVLRYVPSTFAARTELGLMEGIELGEAIRRTAEWYKSKYQPSASLK